MAIRNRKVTLAEVRAKGLDTVISELENRRKNQTAIMSSQERQEQKPDYSAAAEIAEQKQKRAQADAGEAPKYAQNVAPKVTTGTYGAMGQQQELSGFSGQLEQDKKQREQQQKAWEEERKARAKAEHYRTLEQQQKDEETLQADIDELNNWTEEDREALKTYIIERGYESGVNPMYSAGTARAKAAKLFEKYGAKKVNELAESYGRWENARNAEEIAQAGIYVAAGDGFGGTLSNLGANIVSVGTNVAGAVTGGAGYLEELTRRTGRYSTLDPNNAGQVFGTWGGAVREETARRIGESWAGNVGATVYQGAMSAADSLARALTLGPAGAATLAATDSAARTISEASRQGASPAQAVTLGIATAGIEYLTEKIPMERLFKAAKGGAKGAGAFIKEVLKQGGIEAATEEISLLGSMAAEAVILGERDSTRQRIGDLVANGMSYQEAREQVNRENWDEAVQTFAVSFAAGVFGSGAGQAIGARANRQEAQPQQQQTQAAQPQAVQTGPQAVQAEPKTAQQRLMETMAPIAQNAPRAETDPETERASQVAQGMLSGIVSPQTVDTQEQSTGGGQRQVEQWERDNVEGIRQVIRDVESGMSQQELREKSRQYEAEYERLQSGGTEGERRTAHFLYSAYDSAAKNPQATAQMYRDAMPQLEADIGIKGTGAAEANFSGKRDFYDLLGEDNMQPDRATDVRPMEMIRTDAQGRNVSDTAGNLYGAGVTSDDMADEIQKLAAIGALSFDRRSNREAMAAAAEEIKRKGRKATEREITNRAMNGKPKEGDIEKGMLLYAEYVRKGDIDSASEMAVDLATLGHRAGRDLQLFKLLRMMTPEGQLMTMQKSIERNVESLKKSGSVSKDYETGEIAPELQQDYLDAAKEAMEAKTPKEQKKAEEKLREAETAIMEAEAARLPATFKEKWNTWRYMAMLGNAKTQIRNFMGNALWMPYKAAKDTMAAAAESFLLPKSQRTKAVLNMANEGDRKLLDWAKQDAKSGEVSDALKYSAKLGDDMTRNRMDEGRRIFNTEALERVRKFVESVPQKGDMWFKNPHYANSLAGFLKARGYTVQQVQNGEVSAEIMTEARSYAIEEAMKATFNDSNAFSDFVSNLRYRGDNVFGKVANIIGEGVLPFRRTPANILVRFTEYSPVGLAKTAWDAAAHLRNGDMSAAAVIDELAAGLTGSAAMTLGFFLAKGIAGFNLRGSNTDDDEKRQGHQDYALEFSIDGQEYSYKIDWAAPANLPLFLGANLYEIMSGKGQDTSVSAFTSFIYNLGNMFEPMLSLSCLSGLNDLFEAGRYAREGGSLYAAAAQIATGYFTQGIPALLRQSAQAGQEVKQSTFANSPDPLLRDIGREAANIPYLDKIVDVKTDAVNAWGEKEVEENGLIRAFHAYLNPGTWKKIDNSELEREVMRLNEAVPDSVSPKDTPKAITYTDKNGQRHQNHRLTEEEYQTLATTQGQTAADMLNAAIKNPAYKAMTDAQKAKVFEYVYDYAREKGRAAALEGYDGMAEWMKEVSGKDPAAIIRRVASAAMDDSISGSDAQELSQAYKVYQGMNAAQRAAFREDAAGRVKYYLEAKDAGIKESAFLSLYSKYRAIDGNGKKASQKANEWALALDKARQNGTITREQAEALKTSMVFRTSLTADSEKYDEMVSTGVKPETAYDVSQLLAGIKPYEGSDTVKPVQKYEAIAESKYTDAEKDLIMKAYMPDYDPTDESPNKTELKYDTVRDLGYSPEEYVDIYQAYLDADKKAQKIAAIQRLGYSYTQAQLLYSIFEGKYFKGK